MTIDILRGLAIFVMIGANMIPELLSDSPSILFRLYASFAAPTFIFLSGMMVSFTINKRNHTALYFIKRALLLLFTGAALDIALCGIFPFMTFDVLYLIGVSIILTFLFKRLKPSIQYILVLAVFIVTPLLQNFFGYQKMPVEIPLQMITKNITLPVKTVLRQWLIDGWFPLFPWLGFAFLGSIAADIRLKVRNFSNIAVLFTGLIILILGEIIWSANTGQIFIRKGYSELFYPPAPGFLLTAAGVIIILFYIVDIKNSLGIYKPFSILGRRSLQIYVVHLVLIFLLGKLIMPQGINIFLLLYIGIVLLILGFCCIMDRLICK